MSDTVIRVENLGKKYILGHQQQERYTALRDVIANGAKGLIHSVQNGKGKIQNNQEEFWALKDVSFEIKQGDRVGIIGRNGAGKSTLLKILSRITEPTKGSIKIKGRVASLLEVGTGFHPELTGRENIYLNGAILGMGKEEIKRKFDEIVAFAEVEKFLDTPVKRYSSGMYVRLAFAVAAHLEPEILIVDEVLAVGDAQFQKKCLGKMEDVGKEGRTVLFVSHNMASLRSLCSKALLLSRGSLACEGAITTVMSFYMQDMESQTKLKERKYSHIKGNGKAQIHKIFISNSLDESTFISVFDSIRISIKYRVYEDIKELDFFILIYSIDDEIIASSFQRDSGLLTLVNNYEGTIQLVFKNCFAPGKYFVSAGIFDKARNFLDWVEQVEYFTVDNLFNNGNLYDNRLGKVTLLAEWSLKE